MTPLLRKLFGPMHLWITVSSLLFNHIVRGLSAEPKHVELNNDLRW
jgi:hypothetical protein